MFGWFARNRREPPQSDPRDRYAGRPLLILLENYVLDCIGHLPEDKQPTLRELVQRVYGGGTDWKATLRGVLHLDDSLDAGIRQLWVKNQEIARQANQKLSPEDFARMVADQNFAELLK